MKPFGIDFLCGAFVRRFYRRVRSYRRRGAEGSSPRMGQEAFQDDDTPCAALMMNFRVWIIFVQIWCGVILGNTEARSWRGLKSVNTTNSSMATQGFQSFTANLSIRLTSIRVTHPCKLFTIRSTGSWRLVDREATAPFHGHGSAAARS